jgi:alpha-1,2-mannosyltransferase
MEMSPMNRAVGASWRTLLIVVVASAVTLVAFTGLTDDKVGFDLVTVYVPAADRVLDGESPFPALDSAVFESHQAYVYPPLTALLAVPFTALPDGAVDIVGVLLSIALLLLALFVAGVRDPRCYAVFALWLPTMTAWQNANVTVLLLLATALTWRFRDSWTGGAALGLGIALKLLLWPLTFWLLVTRRVRAAIVSVAVAAVALLGSWAVIGFEGLTGYPDLLRRLTEVEGENGHGVSIYSGVLAAGLPSGVGHAASVLVGGTLLAACVVLARRGDDRGAFTLALVAVLALTPLVWLHYLTLLAIPLAIYRPRLSGEWAVPWLLWLVEVPGWPFEPRRALAFVVVVVLIGRLVMTPSPGRSNSASVSRRTALPEAGP